MLKRVCVNKSSLSVSGLRCSTGVLSKSAVAVNCRSIHTSWKGCTFQYQKSLPRLPIPDLTKTCDRYLKVVRPILDDAEYSRTKLVVGDFAENGHGDALHEALLKYDKSKGDSSYIDEFWSAMYLKDVRAPLPIHSNPFLQLVDDTRPGQQEAVNRAASLIASTLRFRDCLMNETLEPDVFHMGKTAQQDWFKTMMRVVPKSIAYYFAYAVKSYPLDMAQYPLLFGTARVPGADGDHLVSNDTATHIAVLSNGHVYQLDVYDKDGIALTEPTLAAKLRKIEQDSNERGASSTPVAALTSDTRDNWAVQRAELEKDNAQQLEMIDTALFTVSFDSSKPGNNTEAEAAEAGKVFLCGDVANRWYDKSLQFIVASNGAAAINFEHSWGDGVSVLRLANEIHEDAKAVEAVAAQEKSDAKAADKTTAAQEGDAAGAVEVVAEQEEAEPVTPLQWSLSPSVASAVKSATQRYNDEVNTLQIQALKINGFGKQFFKEQKIAPDGTVQQAIQLAYRRAFPDTPRAVATYESASTAAFKKGRTETIRPATIESSAMVNEFMNSSDKRADALRKAAEKHRQLSTEAALGQGVDRHLFALRKMAEQRGSMPGIFTDPAYAKVNHNILSTSTLVSDAVANGGFGPVVADGFGVGYATTDSQIGFMITSYKSREEHQKFMQELKNALEEMKDVLEKN